MADIPTAQSFGDPLDPHEILDFVFDLTDILEPGEEVEPGEWTLEIPIEGTGLGLEIMTGDGRDPALIDGTMIKFWATIEAGMQDDAIFDGAGASVPLRVTSPTSSTPQRVRQRTAKLRIVQQ